MSLILKGIDLPTNGETLIVGIYGDGNVSIEHAKPLVLAIDPIAEAIQIPKGHGDIKDVSEAIKGWCEGCAFKDTEECADCKDKEMYKYAPTILESEGNDESDT